MKDENLASGGGRARTTAPDAPVLASLSDGRALTEAELVRASGLAPSAVRARLGPLVASGIVAAECHRRRLYYRLVARTGPVGADASGPDAVVAHGGHAIVTGPRDPRLRTARRCYGHVAGRLGVAIAGHLVESGAIVPGALEGSLSLTPEGAGQLRALGIAVAIRPGQQPRGRCCLDWSERRTHVGGALGAMILTRCLDAGWLRTGEPARALEITPQGERSLRAWLGPGRLDAVAP